MVAVLEALVRGLVDAPETVTVTESSRKGGTVFLEVTVSRSDMGRVIGKQGRTAQAIRTVAKAAAARENLRAVIDIDA